MRTSSLLSIFFFSALFTTGCKDDKKKEAGGGPCLTAIDCDAGFDCVGGLCMPPGVTTTTAGTASGTSGGTDGTTTDATGGKGSTGGDPCPEKGVLYCPCDNGECAPGLLCTNTDICIVDPCPPGTEGCVCDDGACPAPLDCVNGFCTDLSGGMCQGAYDVCDFDLLCCEAFTCVGNDAMATYFECVPPCTTHSECPAQCCTNVQDTEGTFCAVEAAFCQDNGFCIDTCYDANDGFCDDGGPGSDYSLCELGTDCADCGVR